MPHSEVDESCHPADLISHAALRFGSRPAFTLVMPDGVAEALSFDDVDRLSDRFAAFLVATLGMQPGAVLAVQLANGLPFPIVVFGAWKAGMIVTPINPYYTMPETWRQLLDSGARVLVADVASAELVRSAGNLPDFDTILVDGAGLPSLAQSGREGGGSQEPLLRSWSLSEALANESPHARFRFPVALYQYTGGTTGRSKAAILTAANLLSTRRIVSSFFAEHGSPIEGGVALTALPLYHIFAFLFGMLVYVEAGTNNVIVPAARPVSALRPAFEGYAIDWMAAVDTLYAGLLAEDWFRSSPPRLKFAIAGGAALRPSVGADWEQLVGPLLEGYGLTETTGIVSCNPPTGARRIGSIGFAVSESEVRLVDDDGQDVSPGTAGEVVVRGPQVASGYLDRATESDAFFDGWFRTGDIAVVDSLGMLTIMDRKKDMIIVSGFNVYPNEVEAVLSSHPGIAEAAVIGVANERSGEAVRAYIVLRDPALTVDEIDRHCRVSLAAYKVPREFMFRQDLPRSAVGKILRSVLRDGISSQIAS